MKKLLKLSLALLLSAGLVGCGGSQNDDKTLTVAATLDPHSKILEEAKPILKEEYDIDLQIKVLDDYNIFNRSLNDGQIDANYFQHVPFFEEDVEKNKYDIVNVAGIHMEPFGFYSKTIKDVSEVKNGAEVIISNSVADYGRVLSILDDAGLIEMKEGVDVTSATLNDIASNLKNLKFIEVKPELLATSFKNGEGDLVAINGNYAIQAGLNPTKDAVILEKATQDNPYVNIVACKKGHENDEKIQALIKVLKSDKIKSFIEETYKGSVILAGE